MKQITEGFDKLFKRILDESPLFTGYSNKNEKYYNGDKPLYIVTDTRNPALGDDPLMIGCAIEPLPSTSLCQASYAISEHSFPLLFETYEEAGEFIKGRGLAGNKVEEASKYLSLNIPMILRRTPCHPRLNSTVSAGVDNEFFNRDGYKHVASYRKAHMQRDPDYYNDLPEFENIDENLINESPLFTTHKKLPEEKTLEIAYTICGVYSISYSLALSGIKINKDFDEVHFNQTYLSSSSSLWLTECILFDTEEEANKYLNNTKVITGFVRRIQEINLNNISVPYKESFSNVFVKIPLEDEHGNYICDGGIRKEHYIKLLKNISDEERQILIDVYPKYFDEASFNN